MALLMVPSSCHFIDCFHVFSLQHFQRTAGRCVVAAALTCHLLDFVVGDVAAYEFLDVYGHADGMIEAFHCLDALLCRALGVGKVVGHIHHVHGEAHEAAQVLVHHIACPAGPDGSQSGTMGNVEHSAQFVLQLVGSPVVGNAAARQSPVGHAAAPHNLGAVAIVLRILQHGEDGGLHAAQHGLGQVGGQVHIVVLREIALHGVHHHVGHAGSRLIGRQGEGAVRIHDGKLRARHVVRVAQLHVAVLVGDDAGFAHLAAGSGNGQHRCHGQHRLRFGLAQVEVPNITVEAYAIGNALG